MCSYVTRPPLAAGSLEKVADDKYLFKMKSPWSDGTSYIILSGHELLEKLAAIVPPPRAHTTRYHGLLAPNSKLRAQVVPAESTGNTPSGERKKSGSTKYRLTWAALLARVFQIDVSVCPACGHKCGSSPSLPIPLRFVDIWRGRDSRRRRRRSRRPDHRRRWNLSIDQNALS